MATEEVQAAALEEIVVDLASADPAADKEEVSTVATGKEEKQKKSNPKKLRKRATPSHPTYVEMIGEAIASLKERTGSSQYAITKFIEDKHKESIPPNFRKILLVQLRKLSATGKLNKVKNSYKLPSIDAKKPVAPAKPKSKALKKVSTSKPKTKLAVKPKTKLVAKAKPKTKTASSAKAKPSVAKKLKPVPKKAPTKLKPVPKKAPARLKTVAAKPTARPAKAAKSSVADVPGKKAAQPAEKKAVVKSAKKVKSAKPAAKSPAKKTPARKAKKPTA